MNRPCVSVKISNFTNPPTPVPQEELTPPKPRDRTTPPVAPISTLVLCDQAEWMDLMPTLLAPERVKPAHRAFLHSPSIAPNAGPETPRVARRRQAAKRNIKKRKKTKLVAIVIPVKPGPYSHLPRLKIDGTQRKGKENHLLTPMKDKMRPTRQRIIVNAVSTAINAPSLALSTWLRSKEKFDASQTSPPPLGLRSSIGWSLSSLSLSQLARRPAPTA
ncbi:hypothetical protein DXG01_016074 [Tephrocybe rancida]|nr:hypothetical protein DXG01_016074 [Tephrocybe rancida]